MLFFIAFIGIVMFVISRFNIAASSFEEEALAERNRQETRRKQHALLLQPLPGSGTHQVSNVVEKQFSLQEQACNKLKAAQFQHRALFLQPEPGSGTHQVSNVVEKQFSLQEKVCEKEKAAQRQHRALFLQPEPGSGVHRQRK